jgi:hypothetical protein
MDESTVNIADFRGIRETKPRTASVTRDSSRASYGFLVIDSRAGYGRPLESSSSAVFDIGVVREAQRFGRHSGPGAQRGAKVLRFTGTSNSETHSCRGVATWNESCDDPTDCPPAA